MLSLCRAGTFAFVLTARQMGKSSLMVRTAEQLYEEGIRSVIIDLTRIGKQVTADQWYVGLLVVIQEQLELSTEAAEWWNRNRDQGPVQRMTRFLEEVVLKEVPGRVVVFVDEIDTTLGMGFTDDFYAAIRYLYNARASDPELARLSFVLVGVATPGDLDPGREAHALQPGPAGGADGLLAGGGGAAGAGAGGWAGAWQAGAGVGAGVDGRAPVPDAAAVPGAGRPQAAERRGRLDAPGRAAGGGADVLRGEELPGQQPGVRARHADAARAGAGSGAADVPGRPAGPACGRRGCAR